MIDGWREATSAENYNGFVNLGKRKRAVQGHNVQDLGAHSRAETCWIASRIAISTPTLRQFHYRRLPKISISPQLATSGSMRHSAPGRLELHGAYGWRSTAERFNVNQAPDDNVRSLTTNGTVGFESGLAPGLAGGK